MPSTTSPAIASSTTSPSATSSSTAAAASGSRARAPRPSRRSGPWLVTKDEIPDPQNLAMWLEVDGRRFQDGSTRTMIFGVAHLVSHLSRHMTLLPGDVISTGTPPGVGAGVKPEPVSSSPATSCASASRAWASSARRSWRRSSGATAAPGGGVAADRLPRPRDDRAERRAAPAGLRARVAGARRRPRPTRWRSASPARPSRSPTRCRSAADALAKLPDLEMIAVAATGYDVVDVADCRERGIAVANVRGYAINTVPEHTFALIFALRRIADRLPRGRDRGRVAEIRPVLLLRPTRSRTSPAPPSGSSAKARIGQRSPSSARPSACAPSSPRTKASKGSAPSTRPSTRCWRRATSSPSTARCCRAPATCSRMPEFRKMKRRPLLINASRGGLVHEADLVRALDEGLISGIGFDCLTSEPPTRPPVLADPRPPERHRHARTSPGRARGDAGLLGPAHRQHRSLPPRRAHATS